jgi:ketosteroid isomerase-like protein
MMKEDFHREPRAFMRKRADTSVDWARRTLLSAVAITPVLETRVAGAAASALKGAGLPADLARAVSDYDHATLHNDVATLSSLVADDYVLVNSDSTLQDKPSYLSDFARPEFRIHPYVIEQPVQKVWREAAVTGGLVRLGWTQDGKHQQRMVRIVHVWARSGARWQIVYTQLTRVPEE